MKALDAKNSPSAASNYFPAIRSVAIGALQQNPRNGRTHSKKQIKQIAASISQWGFFNPVIVDENNVILAGHGRVEAARIQGMAHVPAVCVDHLTLTQKRAYVIADNRIAEQAGWDREILSIELGELAELLPLDGLDVSLTGFETGEVDLILSEMSQGVEPDSPIPDLPDRPASRLGDLWLLGRHRLLCADAQHSKNFDQLMDGATVAAAFTDPPYNLKVSSIGGRGAKKHPEFAFGSGEMNRSEFRKFLVETLGHGHRISAEGAVHYVCMDWRHIDILIEVGRELFGAMLNLVVWRKSNAGQGSFYRSQHELIGIFRVGDCAHQNNINLGRFGRSRSNVWTYPGANTFGKDRLKNLSTHPTVKPTALVADALLDCTKRGDLVLDQFAGSGTILLAAERTGRAARAMEYEPRYVDVAIQRWQEMTKRDAVLVGDGRTFAELAKIRASAASNEALSSATNRKTRPPQKLPKDGGVRA